MERSVESRSIFHIYSCLVGNSGERIKQKKDGLSGTDMDSHCMMTGCKIAPLRLHCYWTRASWIPAVQKALQMGLDIDGWNSQTEISPAVMDVGHSLQKVVIDATRMRLGTCWIGSGAGQESILHNFWKPF